MSYLIECRMPGCEWKSRQPDGYFAVEADLMAHVLKEHTHRAIAEVLVASWQYEASGKRQKNDPLTVLREYEDDALDPPVVQARQKKMKYGKPLCQLILETFDGNEKIVLSTAEIGARITEAISRTIPIGSLSTTLNGMKTKLEITRVEPGKWSLYGTPG